MIKRTDYIEIIEEIRNTESKTLDEFILKILEPLREEDPFFIETLYKDVHYLIKGINKDGEGDLAIENGDLVIEDGSLKLTGYQSRLHSIAIWLHIEMIAKFADGSPDKLIEKLQNFETHFLEKPNYTPEYKAKLDQIKRSLKRERQQNLNEKESWLAKVLNPDFFEIKPNINGLGINVNEIINRVRKK